MEKQLFPYEDMIGLRQNHRLTEKCPQKNSYGLRSNKAMTVQTASGRSGVLSVSVEGTLWFPADRV